MLIPNADTTLDPLAEPTTRVTPGFIAVLALTNLGIWTAFFTPIQFLLPLQVDAIDPAGKEASLGIVVAIGALVSLVASPSPAPSPTAPPPASDDAAAGSSRGAPPARGAALPA